MATRASSYSPLTLAAARALACDECAAETIRAFSAARIRTILFRGPVIARWLYGDGTLRSYVDVDLLVAPADFSRAQGVLSTQGFRHPLATAATCEGAHHSETWVRPPGPDVDLHRTLFGIRVEADELWRVLSERTERLTVGGVSAEGVTAPALALVVALHTAQHGASSQLRVRELRRALQLAPLSTWEDATALAERLDALSAFATGLRLVEPGARLAAHLGLPATRDAETLMLAESPPHTALGFAQLARARGARGKALLLARKLVPTPAMMCHIHPLARRGRAGLIASYAWRPLSLLLDAGPGFLAWRRARRAAMQAAKELS